LINVLFALKMLREKTILLCVIIVLWDNFGIIKNFNVKVMI
jgi:hypothetical protein